MLATSGHGHSAGAAPRKGVSESSRVCSPLKGLHQGGDPQVQGAGEDIT